MVFRAANLPLSPQTSQFLLANIINNIFPFVRTENRLYFRGCYEHGKSEKESSFIRRLGFYEKELFAVFAWYCPDRFGVYRHGPG